MTKTPPCRLRLTGRVELCDPRGNVVPVATRKALLLLAILAHSGPEGARRAEIAEAVWPRAEPRAARESLRTALSALRKALGPDAIRAAGESVALDPARLVVEEGEGEFMPGFDEEWAVDRRLTLRARAVAQALADSRAAPGPQEALAHAERACATDPLDGEAARRRIDLLAQAGRRAEAIATGDAHRARVVREMGFVPDVRAPEPTLTENPLVRALGWTLERDPEEACALLAATQGQWLTLAVETALDAHRRVLAATARPSRDRRAVEAGASYLQVIAGDLDDLPALQARYREALATDEPGVAARFCDALAYGHLSKGEFAHATAYAGEGVRSAQARGDAVALAYAQATLGIIEGHVGNPAARHRWVSAATALMEEHGSSAAIRSVHATQTGILIDLGQFDRAIEWIDRLQRGAEGRERVWIVSLEAELHEHVGDLAAARGAFERMRSIAADAGQCAVAVADDGLMRVNCGLRLYDESAEALARVVRYRRRKGTVPSRHERAVASPSLQTLRERLDARDLTAAFQRATLAG